MVAFMFLLAITNRIFKYVRGRQAAVLVGDLLNCKQQNPVL